MSRAAATHEGATAPTAEALMRSRYSAFAVGNAGYLLRTWHSSGRPRKLSFDPALRWTRLAILETRGGGLLDATGTVQFRAMYVQQGQRGVLAERANSSGKTDTGPTSVRSTEGRLPHRAITFKGALCQTTQKTGPCQIGAPDS